MDGRGRPAAGSRRDTNEVLKTHDAGEELRRKTDGREKPPLELPRAEPHASGQPPDAAASARRENRPHGPLDGEVASARVESREEESLDQREPLAVSLHFLEGGPQGPRG